MKNQNFGIEIEMTGITRSTASKVIAGYFHTDATHVGGCYDAYSVRDNDGRMWKIMRDASVRCENRSGQNASSLYSVEFVTPICNYDDIETIQELVRKLRGAGARVNSSCGLHCHINAVSITVKRWTHAFLMKSITALLCLWNNSSQCGMTERITATDTMMTHATMH